METHDATELNDAGGVGTRTAQSPGRYLSGTERAKAQTKPRPKRYIEAGQKLAALSVPAAAARLGGQAYTSGSR
jgi:hypothetical protein